MVRNAKRLFRTDSLLFTTGSLARPAPPAQRRERASGFARPGALLGPVLSIERADAFASGPVANGDVRRQPTVTLRGGAPHGSPQCADRPDPGPHGESPR